MRNCSILSTRKQNDSAISNHDVENACTPGSRRCRFWLHTCLSSTAGVQQVCCARGIGSKISAFFRGIHMFPPNSDLPVSFPGSFLR